MSTRPLVASRVMWVLVAALAVFVQGCAAPGGTASKLDKGDTQAPMYIIGPGDNVNIFVWRNPELSTTVPVRPDGRITTPLVEDVMASGRTPSELARVMEDRLSTYIKNPVVTVMVTGFQGRTSEQIRVVGEAANPQALPYRERMTLLDVMIAVGGLTEFAAGNRAVLLRRSDDGYKRYDVRLDDLIKEGKIEANVRMLPGDVLVIPEAFF